MSSLNSFLGSRSNASSNIVGKSGLEVNTRCVRDKKGGAYLKTYKEKTKIPSSEIGFSLVVHAMIALFA